MGVGSGVAMGTTAVGWLHDMSAVNPAGNPMMTAFGTYCLLEIIYPILVAAITEIAVL